MIKTIKTSATVGLNLLPNLLTSAIMRQKIPNLLKIGQMQTKCKLLHYYCKINTVKKQLLQLVSYNPKHLFLKIRSKMVSFIFKNLLPFCNCITNHYYFVINLITFLSSIDRVYCQTYWLSA